MVMDFFVSKLMAEEGRDFSRRVGRFWEEIQM